MNTYRIYCAGRFIETGTSHNVVNPFTGKTFALTWLAGVKELEEAIMAAAAVQNELKGMPTYLRYNILMSIKEGLQNLRQEFAELISLESGKPLRYALSEVDRSIQSFSVAAEECRRLPKEFMSIDWTAAGKGKEGLVKYFPIGIVAGISPFNFPLNLAVHKIAPAIAAGCPIILKPSSTTPLTTLMLAGLIAKTELPLGAVSVLPMDRITGNQLVTDERISLLSFTGSPAVGWEMKRQAGRKKVVLELGGNAGVIITGSANLDEAIPKCVTGGFSYSGQVCIHTQRIYVMKEQYERFTLMFVDLAGRLKQGDPLDPATEISGMIDEPNARRVEGWVNEAIGGGAKILLGGSRSGGYYQPTILTQTRPEMKVCCEEVFGPVVVIEPVVNLAAAVERINEGCFGLQAGVFTDSIDEMNFVFNNLEVGGVILNDVPTFRVDHMPYGGVKDSGQGREGIRYAIFDMLEPRLLVKNC
jgi:acyl-CoA reductase-like NAD-dependent aldehyde dehydrogenase